MTTPSHPLALVTGASSGIGYELARQCALHGYDLLIAADEPEIEEAAARLRELGTEVEAVEADLSTVGGIDRVIASTRGQAVDLLFANAGRALGRAFLDQDFADIRRVVDTNVAGTLLLVQRVARDMRGRGGGHVLVTGSIVGSIPGPYNAVYNGTKAFLNSFCFALRHELRGSGVSVTCLEPGATETEAYARAGMMDTLIGQVPKGDAAVVARDGFEAMLRGDGAVVSGWFSKLQATAARVMPAEILAVAHSALAKPGTGPA